MSYIYSIIKQNKYSLLLIYFYIVASQLLFLCEPFILGKTIDGLLHKDYFWLICFLIVEVVANMFMYKRMVYDTKVYTKIYNDIVFRYLDSDKKSSTSEKVARTEMANNIINFLENDIHYYIASIITVVGSLCFIYAEHFYTGVVVSICVLPIVLVVCLFYGKIAQMQKVIHTHYEQKFAIMDSEIKGDIDTFFKRRRRTVILNSTLQGRNWISLLSIKTLFLIVALIVFTCDAVNLTQGQAISMYAYINQFLISLLSIPVGMEILTRIKDVINRIKEPIALN